MFLFNNSISYVNWIRLLLLATVMLTSGCQMLFPKNASKDLQHFAQKAPQSGTTLPNLQIVTLDGEQRNLSEYVDGKPLVLQLGSHSCPVYRYRRFDMNKLQREFADTVDFLTIYTVEAHPASSKSPYREGEWLTGINRVTGVRVPQPDTLVARINQASYSIEELGTPNPVVVDAMQDEAWNTFGSAPSPAYVIDERGQIVLRQVWVNPKKIKQALDELLPGDS